MAKRRLPPLYTLRGFDAAARHLSFSLAAQELHVTQGAIRRQIRELEDFLGTSLFLRATRRVDLTEAGKDYFFAVAHILAELERATERLSRKRKSKTLTLDILPTIATMWLMPLLEQFSETNPEVDLRILTSIQPADFGSGSADIAIRVGRLPGRSYSKRSPRIELEMVTPPPSSNVLEFGHFFMSLETAQGTPHRDHPEDHPRALRASRHAPGAEIPADPERGGVLSPHA